MPASMDERMFQILQFCVAFASQWTVLSSTLLSYGGFIIATLTGCIPVGDDGGALGQAPQNIRGQPEQANRGQAIGFQAH